jgi:hypothetical protein
MPRLMKLPHVPYVAWLSDMAQRQSGATVKSQQRIVR